ncbi:hypothetical protein [Streptomyces sp. NPDC048568]|uniref:hypothetical protein n=1 Tax=Streptomyces sp. NPDC048568 TaxID=3365571 RepID=UPI0037163E08
MITGVRGAGDTGLGGETRQVRSRDCGEGAKRAPLSPDGPVAGFLPHIEGHRAWFRWSDELFERTGDDG